MFFFCFFLEKKNRMAKKSNQSKGNHHLIFQLNLLDASIDKKELFPPFLKKKGK